MFESMRAAGLYGRALKLQRKGSDEEAIEALTKALGLLGRPHVDRTWPPVFTLVICAGELLAVLCLERKTAEPGRSALKNAIALWESESGRTVIPDWRERVRPLEEALDTERFRSL